MYIVSEYHGLIHTDIYMSTVSRLRVRNAALMICDMQEKFRSRIHGFQSAVEGCRVLYSGCVSAGVDCTIVTEQYPKVRIDGLVSFLVRLPNICVTSNLKII